jgi:hypothetical protein
MIYTFSTRRPAKYSREEIHGAFLDRTHYRPGKAPQPIQTDRWNDQFVRLSNWRMAPPVKIVYLKTLSKFSGVVCLTAKEAEEHGKAKT